MAVFTEVTAEELDRWLEHYALGAVCEFRGIPSGIENSNFFVTTVDGAFVLTLFERLSNSQLPFYLELMRHLAQRGIPCPAPLAQHDGALFSVLNGKPAALVTRLPGSSILNPDSAHCALVGAALARMHRAGQDFGMSQPNLRGLEWWLDILPALLPHLDSATGDLLADEVRHQSGILPQLASQLPSGPIHADLFRDNALFDGDRLGGFIDFYFAGCDTWLFDVAVCVNDWCIDLSTGQIDPARYHALLAAYADVRPFTEAEVNAWGDLQRAAALRFWISRLHDIHQPRPAQLLTPHDPVHFERILRLRRTQHYALPN